PASGKPRSARADATPAVRTRRTETPAAAPRQAQATTTARKPMTRTSAASHSATPAARAGTKARGVKPAARPADEALRLALPARVDLPPGYRPGPDEEYMNPMQMEHFRQKLLQWRADLVEESKQTIDNLREEVRDVGDEAERATRETENSLELRTRDRYRKLIGKIDKALRRIDEGAYGYCEETGEEIGIERLEARPIATLCLD